MSRPASRSAAGNPLGAAARRFGRVVGTGPLGLLTLLAAFFLTAYVVSLLGVAGLTGGGAWWQTILAWFLGAVILHDLLLFPLYALADRSLGAGLDAVRRRRPARTAPALPVLNYVRVPALITGLTFLVFWPGILEQGATTYRAATGLTQDPFLGRWLLLVAAAWLASAVLYALRLTRSRSQPPKDASTT